VRDPGPGARTLFLHVFEIADEGALQPAPVAFVAPAGADLGDGRKVRFNAEGPLGGTLDGVPLAADVRTAGQYR
jgi:hypothetical protein